MGDSSSEEIVLSRLEEMKIRPEVIQEALNRLLNPMSEPGKNIYSDEDIDTIRKYLDKITDNHWNIQLLITLYDRLNGKMPFSKLPSGILVRDAIRGGPGRSIAPLRGRPTDERVVPGGSLRGRSPEVMRRGSVVPGGSMRNLHAARRRAWEENPIKGRKTRRRRKKHTRNKRQHQRKSRKHMRKRKTRRN